MYFRITLALLLGSLLSACSIANLQPAETPSANAEVKGRELLQTAYEKMGYPALRDVDVYEATAHFTWSPVWSMMPMNALPGNKNNDIQFRFATGTFDGQVRFLEGPRAGRTYGLQSWEGYELGEDAGAEIRTNKNNRYPWGLATYHYLLESPWRLLNADVIRYAGTTEFDGQTYDRVFVTWGDGTQKRDYDQWLVYINQTTRFIDVTEVTITDFFLPMPGGMKNATVRFPRRERTSIGTYLPTEVVIQLGHPKEDLEKDVYTFTLRDYRFDTFARELLYPLEGRREFGDSKGVGE